MSLISAINSKPGDPGFALHLHTSGLIKKFQEQAEDTYLWMQEILVEAKKAFATPEIELLPKTPAVKRARKKARRKVSSTEKGDEDPDTKAPPRKASRSTRTTRGRKNEYQSKLSSSSDCVIIGDTEDDDTEESDKTPPRKTRAGTRKATTARGSRATTRSTKTRSAKAKEKEMEEQMDTGPAPVMNMVDQIANDKNEKGTDKDLDKDSDVEPIKGSDKESGGDTDKETDKESIKNSDKESGKDSDKENVSIANKTSNTPKTPSTLPVTLSPAGIKNSPRHIRGFELLHVKDRVQAYQELLVEKPTGKTPPTRTHSRQDDAVATPDNQKTSEKYHTPPTVIKQKDTDDTPETLKPETRTREVVKIELVAVQSSSTLDLPPPQRRSSVRRSQHNGPRKSMSSRRSSILKKNAINKLNRRSSAASNRSLRLRQRKNNGTSESENEVVVLDTEDEDEKKIQEEFTASVKNEVTATKTPDRRCTRSKLRLKKPLKSNTPKTPQNIDKTPDKRCTRSKLRIAKPVKPETPQTPKNEPTSDTPEKRCTRSKMRHAKPVNNTPSTPQDKPATPDKRCTRSKMRPPKPVAPLVATSSPEEEKVVRVTRTKTRKRHAEVNSSDSEVEKQVKKMSKLDPGNEQATTSTSRETRRKTEESEKFEDSLEDDHKEEDNSDSEVVDKTPSPPCPRNKVVRPHPTSFLNALQKKDKNNTPNNLNTVVTSFIQRNTPKKISVKEKQDKKKKELEEKRKREEESLKKRDELLKKKIEEKKKKLEERMKRAAEARESRARKEQEMKRRLEAKLEERKQLGEKVRDERFKEEKEKYRARMKKLQEAEDRRKQEEALRLQKLQEQEEEAKRHEEMIERKKQFEEEERQRKIAESNKMKEERLAEMEKMEREKIEKLKREEEEKEKERIKQKEEREKYLALEKAQREKAELERQKEKERQQKEQLEKARELERQKLLEEAEREQARKEEEKRARAEQEKTRVLIEKHNNSVNPANTSMNTSTTSTASGKAKLNTTITMDSLDSYAMTPPPTKPKRLPNPDNYDISNLHSDDSTDDEEAPRKRIPQWAQGASLKASIINQHYHPPDVEKLFEQAVEPCDLTVMFAKKKQRFTKRTSSAVWDSPLLKPTAAT